MGGALFGSAPKASFSTQPTILPQQVSLLDMLSGLLTTGATPPGVAAYAGPTAGAIAPGVSMPGAPTPPVLPGVPQGVPDTTGAAGGALNTLLGSINPSAAGTAYGTGTPANAAWQAYPGAVGYTAPQIDTGAAFTKGVVEPMTQDFLQRTLPNISGQYGRSAGGAFGSEQEAARESAATDLERTLSETGAKFAYDTATANQQAALQGRGLANQALGMAGTVQNVPQSTEQATANLLNTIMSGSTVPWQIGQTDYSNLVQSGQTGFGNQQTQFGDLSSLYQFAQGQMPTQYQTWQDVQNIIQQRLADLISAFGTGTQQTTGVGSGGSTGLVPSLLGGLASNTGAGSAGVNLIARLLGA